MNRRKRFAAIWLLMSGLLLSGCAGETSAKTEPASDESVHAGEKSSESYIDETLQLTERAGNVQLTDSPAISDIPAYSGSPYITVNDNIPLFTDGEFAEKSFETYSELDGLGRCGAAYANIGTDLMPDEKRGSIGQVKPSGWHSAEYDIVEGEHLYNRCHLIGYQLTAENANEKNLITGTRYLNTEGMLPFENMVADYVKETKNHVLYRVTPIFEDDNLVAGGVRMEAMSVEDKGEGILFHVYCYNVQPGISIDYATGESRLDQSETEFNATSDTVYILNTNTHKFHKPSCSSVKQMKEASAEEFTGDKNELDSMGYEPCKRCNP